jgi:putative membrane protein
VSDAHPEWPADEVPTPTPPDGPTPTPEVEWRRLDSRMLLVNPVQELIRFFPLVIGALVVGRSGDSNFWQLLGIAIPVAIGLVRFWITRFRITTTQVELKRSLVGTTVLTARLDRVRAVELTSSPIHRILGLAKVEIGTGSAAKGAEEKFALDALAIPEARELRVALLHRAGVGAPPSELEPGAARNESGAAPLPGPVEDEVLMRLDPGWVRYAPLTSSGSVIAAGVLALLGQVVEQLGESIFDEEDVLRLVLEVSVAVLIPVAILVFLVLGALFAVLGYFVTNWGHLLTRDAHGRSLHVRRGLLTTTETSLERERFRGLEVSEPLGLRLAGAARLKAVVTGISSGESGSTQLVPPAPRDVVDRVGADLLGYAEPLVVPLEQHGPAARTRRWTRALMGASVVPAAVAVVCWLTGLSWWAVVVTLVVYPAAGALAADRYRRLGHALTREHLVVRSGSLGGERAILQRTGIIGWNIQQSWFQRRRGLATLVATTAAGGQAYAAIDVPEDRAVALAHEAVPGLLTPFVAGEQDLTSAS